MSSVRSWNRRESTTGAVSTSGNIVTVLLDKSIGCLVGAAVGDALGGATEDRCPRRSGPGSAAGWRESPPSSCRLGHRPAAGAVPQGRRAHHRRHVDDPRAGAGVREQAGPPRRVRRRRPVGAGDDERRVVYIPDMEREAVLPPRGRREWLVTRLHHAHADPREAGVGNIVNCGAAMYMAPVGVVNAGDPAAAYAEAIEVAGAHQHSFGREAAACSRPRWPPRWRPARRSTTCSRRAWSWPGTAPARRSPRWSRRRRGTTTGGRQLPVCGRPWRRTTRSARTTASPGLGARRPSRLHAIEELPVALGLLAVAGGDFRGVGAGRSTTAGTPTPRPRWRVRSPARSGAPAFPPSGRGRSRRRHGSTSRRRPGLAEVAAEVFALDRARFARRSERWGGLA